MAQLPLSIGGARNILLIGDDGVTIFDTTSNGNAAYIDELEWTTPDFEQALQRILQNQCKRKPVLMLYDMVEQHYRVERVPKVSPFDKKKVVERKLSVTFPKHKIKAALPLKSQKKPKGGGRPDGGAYLFAAVPSSELLSTLVRAVVATGYPIAGLYLLPVESVDMVDKLAKKLPQVSAKRGSWTLFMGQHSNGNLRQVVVRNGELALTRMTPFTTMQSDVEAWVDELVREFKGSTSYLSRLGYSPDDQIDIIVIGPEEAQSMLDERLGGTANITVLSNEDAAHLLGLKITQMEDEDFADLLHVSWTGQKRSFILPLRMEEVQKINQPRMAASALALVLFLGFLYLAFETVMIGSQYLSDSGNLNRKQQELASNEAEYDRLLEKQKEFGYDIRLFKGSFAVQEELNEYAIRPFKLLRGTGLALGPGLTLDEFTLRHADDVNIEFEEIAGEGGNNRYNNTAQNNNPDQAEGYQIYYRLTLSFTPTISPRRADDLINQLVTRLNQSMPDYTAQVEKGVKDLSYEVDMEGEVSEQSTGENFTKEDYVAVIEIRGGV